MSMQIYPACDVCTHFVVFGDRDKNGVAVITESRCQCQKHGVEIPYKEHKGEFLICLDYTNYKTGEKARDWNYEPLQEGMLYSYEDGYNFRESFGPVCRLDALPKWPKEN